MTKPKKEMDVAAETPYKQIHLRPPRQPRRSSTGVDEFDRGILRAFERVAAALEQIGAAVLILARDDCPSRVK